MESEIPENTSKRITSLRFLLAVLVVFIHNNFTTEMLAEDNPHGLIKFLIKMSLVSGCNFLSRKD